MRRNTLVLAIIVALGLMAAGLFAFFLYDLVAGPSDNGSSTARDINLPSPPAEPSPIDEGGESAGGGYPVYPAPLGSARCWLKQGRVQSGQSMEFRVQVRDTSGSAVSEVPVTFSIFGETGVTGSTLSPSSGVTATGGIASTTVTVGSLTGTSGFVQVLAVAGGGSNSLSCQAVILVR